MFSLSEYLIAVSCVFFGIFLWIKINKKYKNLPPGPRGLPFIGNLLQVGREPHLRFLQWAKQYGPIIWLKLAYMDTVIISDAKLAKELFSDNAASGRLLDNPLFFEFTKGNHGVINAEDNTWEQQRRFMIRTLKDLGFAKTFMESLIQDEAKALLDWFRKLNGKPTSGLRLFNAPVVNAIWRLVSGERCEWDETRPYILDAADSFFESVLQVSANGLIFAPVLRHFAPEYLGYKKFLRCIDTMTKIFEDTARKHKENFDASNPRDFVDFYLKEIESTTDPHSSFYKEAGHRNMIAGLFDLFLAGSETQSNTLTWAMLYLCSYPEIQEKVYQEILKNVGSRTPSLSDRSNMPYTEAVIAETFRMSSVISTGVPHRMLEDKMFHGYLLPKGTSVFVNIYAVHRDPDVWGNDHDAFKPERFLNEDKTKFVKNDALIPFSEGKRKCIGDNVGRDTVFIFVTNIVQKFKILPENNEKADMEAGLGYFLVPKPFKLIISERIK